MRDGTFMAGGNRHSSEYYLLAGKEQYISGMVLFYLILYVSLIIDNIQYHVP
jgi:hypothetical protein